MTNFSIKTQSIWYIKQSRLKLIRSYSAQYAILKTSMQPGQVTEIPYVMAQNATAKF